MIGLPTRPLLWLRQWIRCRERVKAVPVTLRYRRLYILPTRQGLVFALLLAAMLLGAMSYASSMAYALTFLLAGTGLAAAHHGHRNLLALTVQPLGAASVFAGQSAAFRFQLDNDSRVARYDVRVLLDGRASEPVDLPPGERRAVQVALPVPRRGRHELPHFVVQSRYPGQLLRVWARLRLTQSVIVYPRPAAVPPARQSTCAGSRDEGRSEAVGDEDFAGLRAFQQGDPPQRIAWKALARGAGLQVKQFAGGSSSPRWLCFDRVPGPVEERLARLCREALEAARYGEAFGLRLPETTLAPATGGAHLQRVLTALALHPGERR